MAKVRIGMVGAGLIAQSHMITLAQDRQASLSVFDADGVRAAAAAGTFRAKVVGSLEDLVAGCDLVWICSPPFAHREAVAAAIRGGKAMFCEKPLAPTGKEAAAIAAMVRKAGLPFYMGQSGRWSEAFVIMHKLVQKGTVGTPVRVWSRRTGYLDPTRTPAWRLDDKLSGGAVVELGVHEIDFIRWVGGDWASVSARGQRLLKPSFQDTMVAVGQLASGAVAHLELSWASPRYLWQRAVEGETGTLFIDDSHIREVHLYQPGKPVRKFGTKEDWQNHQTKENFSLRDQDKAVLKAFRSGKAYAVTLEDGLAAVQTAFAMQRSAAAGGRVVNIATATGARS